MLLEVVLGLLLIVFLRTVSVSDVVLYRSYALKVLGGQIPYVNFFFEYPPASIIYFLLPALFTVTQNQYVIAFACINVVLAILTILFSREMVLILKKNSKKAVLLMSLCLMILINLLLTRYDLLPAFLLVLAFYFYLKNPKKYLFLAIIFVTLNGWVKLYGFILLPFFVIPELKARDFKRLKTILLSFFLASLPFILLMLLNLEGLKWFLNYHGSRGLEVESTYSSVILTLSKLHLIPKVLLEYSFGSVNLITDTLLPKLTFIFFIAAYLLILFKAFKSNWEKDPIKKLLLFSTLTVLVFVLTNKVLSAQYLLWLVPLVVIGSLLLQKAKARLVQILFVLSCILTVIIFPNSWAEFLHGSLLITLLLLARNIFLVVVCFVFFRELYAKE